MTKRLAVPVDGEFVDECHYSRTGWAIWKRAPVPTDDCSSYCTCRPAKVPQGKLSARAEDARRFQPRP